MALKRIQKVSMCFSPCSSIGCTSCRHMFVIVIPALNHTHPDFCRSTRLHRSACLLVLIFVIIYRQRRANDQWPCWCIATATPRHQQTPRQRHRFHGSDSLVPGVMVFSATLLTRLLQPTSETNDTVAPGWLAAG